MSQHHQSAWDQYHQSTPKLLPPTVFEKTAIVDSTNSTSSSNSLNMTINQANINESTGSHTHPRTNMIYNGLGNENQMLLQLSSEIDKLRVELKKLKSENEILVHRNKDFVEQAQLYSEASEHRKISIAALEEVIHKQTREIQTLKCELASERESNAAKTSAAEKKLNDRVAELIESGNLSEARRKHLAAENERLTSEFEKYKTDKEKEINELKVRLEQIRNEKSNIAEEMDSRVRAGVEENRRLSAELAQLRVYINESMPTVQTVRDMSEERQKCEAEIVQLKIRNEKLVGENNALQIRIKSINEILSIQENQLEAKQVSVAKHGSNEKRYHGLLNKWRTKVFELLVQLKSQEINFKKERNDAEKTRCDYMDRLECETSRVRILENVIEDKKAELSVLLNDKTVMSEEMNHLREQNESLEKRRAEDLQSSIELKSHVDRLVHDYVRIEESFRVANKRLSQLDQRVEFAKNRLGVVKALYAAKKQDKRPPNFSMTSILSSIHGSANLNDAQISSLDILDKNRDENDEGRFSLLKNELDKVVNERDILTSRLQQDSEEMETKLNKIRDEHDIVVRTLESQLKEIREASEQREAEAERVREELEAKTRVYDELRTKYDDLEKQLVEMRSQWDADVERRLRERETDFVEKLAAMDEKLNEARREQAKAAVMVRQVERSSTREKERLEALLKSCDSYYKNHLNRLQEKIHSMEKERNTLVMSLRQHGINYSTTLGIDDVTKPLSKSPIGFFERDSNVKNWVEQSDDHSSNIKQINTTTKPTEMTSYWLDSNQTNGSENEEETPYVEDNDDGDEEASSLKLAGSGVSNNAEIMQQIRKIMGDLDLSDDDDDDEQQNETVYGDDRRDQSLFEVEHVIDEFFTNKPNNSIDH